MTRTSRWILCLVLPAGLLGLAAGCSEEEDPTSLGSEATTNHLDVTVERPPFGYDGHGVPLQGAIVAAEFRDMQHQDPQDGGYLVVAVAQGATDFQGTWSCVVTYKETGTYAADIVRIRVSHNQFGEVTVDSYLDPGGRATALVQLD